MKALYLKRQLLQKVGFFILLAWAVFGMFSGSTEPVIRILRGTPVEHFILSLHNGNSIVFNLAIGYLVSVFFWWIVVYLPERRRRTLLRDNLRRRYREFKEGTIAVLLSAAVGGYDSALPQELCDQGEFKAFFNANDKEYWYAALNGLQEKDHLLSDLIMECEILADEVAYVLNNVNIDDPKVHSFFKRLNEHIYRLKNASVYSYDLVKNIGRLMWEIHARWNLIDGQLETDIIEEMIEAI